MQDIFTEEEIISAMTAAQLARYWVRRREAELLHTEAVAQRQQGHTAVARLLEHDASRFDDLTKRVRNQAIHALRKAVV